MVMRTANTICRGLAFLSLLIASSTSAQAAEATTPVLSWTAVRGGGYMTTFAISPAGNLFACVDVSTSSVHMWNTQMGKLLWKKPVVAFGASFACGFLSVFMGGIVAGLALMFTEKNFLEIALLLVGAHLPIMIIEGFITAFSVGFIKKVQPEMLPGYPT